ncbi:hypothetical protein MEO41_26910, partial [Dolichospermum sp. ST_sed4]|nr:hypothetical protein [Dolichospermum sp. ST_sed4]
KAYFVVTYGSFYGSQFSPSYGSSHNRGSNNFSDLSDDEKFLVNDYLPLIKDNPPPEVVQELLEVAKTIGYQAFSRITRELAPDILGAFIGAIVDIAIVKDGRDAFHTEIYRYPFS